MGLGTSLFLIAVGAILRFAVSVSAHGVNVHTIGVILMVVGLVGFVISLGWIASNSSRNRATAPRGDYPQPPVRETVRETEPRY
jgi:hypothetical protein